MKFASALTANLVLFLGIANYCCGADPAAVKLGGKLYEAACNYETAGQTELACKYYTDAINECPEGGFAREAKLQLSRLKVLSNIKSKDFARAEAEIKSNAAVFEKSAGYEWYLSSIAVEYEIASQSEKAREYYALAIEKFPNGKCSAVAKLNLSRLKVLSYIQSKDFAGAEAEIQSNAAAFEKDAGYEWYLSSIAVEYEIARQSEKAREYYARAIEKFPNGKCSAVAKLNLSRLNALAYIESKDFAGAEAEIKSNAAAFETNPACEWHLFSVALWYDDFGKQPQEARKYFSEVASKFPDGTCAPVANLRILAMDAVAVMGSEDSKVRQTIQKIKSDFAGHPEARNIILYIAEKYYEKGMESSSQAIDSENRYFKNSLAILEEELGSGNLSNSMIAEFSYMAGLNLQKIGDFVKAAKSFENSYQADPNFIYADYCLFAQGLCYQKLVEKQLMSSDEAKPIIVNKYSNLINRFPKSSYVPYAELWLQGN